MPLRFTENHCVVSCLLTTNDGESLEPYDYVEALKDKDWERWNASMGDEMCSLEKNGTWVVVPKPANMKIIGSKCVYSKKDGIPGVEPPRFKSRLVAKGYSQREGIDYNEIFSPVVKHVSIRILMQIVAAEDLELEQLDVKTAFLHGDLDEVIYMKQPEGYELEGKEDWVCLLKKSLYGLKQSPRQWNQTFNGFMVSRGFHRSSVDSCVYMKWNVDGSHIYLLLYVDDILVASKSMVEVNNLKKNLATVFEMKDLGLAKNILGMEIKRNMKKLELEFSQRGYIEKVLKLFQMEKFKPVKTPIGIHFKLKSAREIELREQSEMMKSVPYANVVGSIIYMMIGTRPDIAYAVGMVSRFMGNTIREHWLAVKWLLKYLRGSSEKKLFLSGGAELKLVGYSDSDYSGDLDKRRSVTGFVFSFGGTAISWKSGLQKVVALSTTEAEYIALSESAKEAIWLKNLIAEFRYTQEKVEIFCDSESAIALSKNNVHHERTKHVQNKYHFIRNKIEEGIIRVTKIGTLHNPADIFTKVVPVNKMVEALEKIRLSLE